MKHGLRDIFLVLALLMILGGVFFFPGGLTGLFTGQDSWLSYSQDLGLRFTQNGEETIVLEQHPELFDLRSLRLTGKIIGEGSAKVYLEINGTRYLVFTEDDAVQDELSSVTGYVVDVADAGEESKEEVKEEKAEKEEQKEEVKEEKKVEEEIIETVEEPVIEEMVVEEQVIDTVAEDTQTAAQPVNEVIEEVVTEENVTVDIPEENVENVTETVTVNESVTEVINETIEVNETTVDNVSTNETVAEINVTVNETLANVTINGTTNLTINESVLNLTNATNITEVIGGGSGGAGTVANVTVNETTTLNETIDSLNETEEIEENVTEEIIEEIEMVRPDTYYVNMTYREFEPKTLNLQTGDTVIWQNLRGERAPLNAMVVGARNPYTNIRSDYLEPGQTYSWTFNTPGMFIIVDGVITTMEQRIFVEGEALEEEILVPEIDFKELCSETCILPNGINSSEIKLVVELDKGTELELESMQYAVEDLAEQPLDVELRIVDENNNLVEADITVEGIEETLRSGDSLNIEKGSYDLEMVTDNHTIKQLELNDMVFETDLNRILEIDSKLPIVDVLQSYAINPLVEFSSGKARLVAKGNKLYECAEWDFSRQRCTGEFVLLKTIFENESYTVEFENSAAFIETAENLTNVTYEKIKDDPNYEVIIDSAEVDETGTLTVTFHHDSVEELPITIIGKLDNYDLSQNSSVAGENVTLTVPDYGKKKYFRIKVGKSSEVFEFGEPSQVEFNSEIKDSKGQAVDSTIEFIDTITTESKASGKGRKAVDEGVYDLKVKFDKGPVKEMLFDEIEVFENVSEFIRYEDIPEEGTDYVQMYAIDPTAFNFTNATVTVTATGTSLYKCKDWNFTTQSCYGEWSLLQRIYPGEDYTFILSAEDPGLAEVNGTFFDGFESGNLATNNWTNTAGSGWYIDTDSYQGAYAMEGDPRGLTTVENSISTVGYTTVKFSFYAQTYALDGGEYISADWYNGTSWINVLPQTEDIIPYTFYSYSLPASASNNPNFKIRFN
ncbi:MAG: hypothetical protein ABIA37_04880, partial [Candidatus Woesearchaeota archaeon]